MICSSDFLFVILDVAAFFRLVEDTLASGKVIPGFGHGVLRNTDPCRGRTREAMFRGSLGTLNKTVLV